MRKLHGYGKCEFDVVIICRYLFCFFPSSTINCKIIPFIMTYKSIFSARIVNVWNSLPNLVVDTCTVNAFKARLDKFWQHQSVKFDFTADLTGLTKT